MGVAMHPVVESVFEALRPLLSYPHEYPYTRNQWVGDDRMSAYARCGRRYLDGFWHRCFDLASVMVGERLRNRGLFTELLTAILEAPCTWDVLYIESILNPPFGAYLERNGFRRNALVDEAVPSVYLYRTDWQSRPTPRTLTRRGDRSHDPAPWMPTSLE